MTTLPEPDPSAASRAGSDSRAQASRLKTRLETLKPRVQQGARLPQVGPAISDVVVVERVRVEADDPDSIVEPATIRERLRRNRKPISSVGVSFAFHAMVLILLLWLATQWRTATQLAPGVLAEFTDVPVVQELIVEPSESVTVDIAQPETSPLDSESVDLASDTEAMADTDIPSVLPAELPVETPAVSEATLSNAKAVKAANGGGLQGRDAEARAALAAKHGGSAASEAAVERALAWIIRHQYADGGWRLQFHDGPCDGRCGDEGSLESPTSATSLALLALMGAGYTSDSGPYQTEVAAGIDFLTARMRKTGYGGSFREGEKGMYAQGLATMALSEAFAMTKESGLTNSIAEAVTYIEKAQHSRGGWRYEAGYPGDMLVTGWQVMALKSASQAGFPVDPEVLRKADQFVDSLASTQSGLYCYGQQGRVSGEPASTAVGMLMKIYSGKRRDDPGLREGALYLSDLEPSPNNIYFNYYATMVLHHRRGRYWEGWNQKMRDFLIGSQVRSGHEDGSWHFNEPRGSGREGGRLYSTAMAAMTLEVYYRFLPLYGYEPIEVEQEVSADSAKD